MNIQEFINHTYSEERFHQRPVIVCKDGFRMSVQGSEFHYCQPRSTQNYYSSMEIGFPNQKEPLIMKWAEAPAVPTESVYGYVPCNVIDEVIIKHGGIDQHATFHPKPINLTDPITQSKIESEAKDVR
jgi:hypothetical protein